MGALDINATLANAGKRKPDDRTLAQQATELAQELLIATNKEMHSDERTLLSALHRMATDEKNCRFVRELSARVLHLSSPEEQAGNLRALISEHGGIPSIFSTMGKLRLKAAAMASHSMQSAALAEVQRIFRSTFGGLTLPAQEDKVNRRVREWAKLHLTPALHPLAPEVFGDKSAARYLSHLETILSKPEALGIVVQPHRLCPTLSPYAPGKGATELADKFRGLFRLAVKSGGNRPILIQCENSLTLGVVVEAFKLALSKQEFHHTNAILELPAYLKNSPAILRDLTDWAGSRAAKGASPIKLLLVKGSHLTREQENSFRHGEANPVSRSKAETETRYKTLVHTAIQAKPKAITPVIGTHNLFDIAYALLDWARNGREGMPEFCFICGLADHVARLLGREGARVTLSTAIAQKHDEAGFDAYLLELVQELARPDGVLTAGAAPDPGGMGWGRMRQQFLAALSGREDVTQERPGTRQENSTFSATPLSRLTDRNRIDTLQAAARAEVERTVPPIPHTINEKETPTPISCIKRSLSAPGMEDYRFTSADFDSIRQILTLAAQSAVQMQPMQEDLRMNLLQAARLLEKNESELIALLIRDGGFTLEEADTELRDAIDACRFYEQSIISPGLYDGTIATPLGVIVVAPDRTHPLSGAMSGIAAAWVTGNAVVYKPSFHHVLLANRLTQLLAEIGMSSPRLQMVACPDNQIADALMCDPSVNGLIIRGSRRTLSALDTRAPERPLLGGGFGRSIAYLASSANWHQAIPELAKLACKRAGQSPDTPNIVLVHSTIYDNQGFMNALRDYVHSLSARPGHLEGGQLGPLIHRPTREQEELLTRLESNESWLVQPHTDEIGSQTWYPGVRTGVLPGSVFTLTAHHVPVIGLVRVENTSQALALQAELGSGYASILYSNDEPEIADWSRQVGTGNVAINCSPTAQPGVLPMGGWGTASPMLNGRNFITALSSWQENARPQTRSQQRNLVFTPWEALSPKPTPDETTRLGAAADSIAYWWEKEFGVEHTLSASPLFVTTLSYHPVALCLRVEKTMTDVDLSILLMAALKAGCPLQLSTAALRAWMPRALEHLGVNIIVENREEFENRFAALAAEGFRVRDIAATATTRAAASACRLQLCSESVLANGRLELLHYLRERITTRGLRS